MPLVIISHDTTVAFPSWVILCRLSIVTSRRGWGNVPDLASHGQKSKAPTAWNLNIRPSSDTTLEREPAATTTLPGSEPPGQGHHWETGRDRLGRGPARGFDQTP